VKISCQFKPPDIAKRYRKMSREIDRKLENLVAVTVRQTSYNAKSFATVDKSGMKASIRPLNKGKTGEVIVGAGYGPYVEFGTGSKVQVPPELREYAMQFKGAGIRQVNLRARPYLYPAYFVNRDKFIRECDKILRGL